MKLHVNDFVGLFVNIDECTILENFQELDIQYRGITILIPKVKDAVDTLKFLNKRDKLAISIIINNGESIDFDSNNSISDFLEDVSSSLSIKNDDEEVFISFKIIKTKTNDIISSYYNDILFDGLLLLEPKGILYAITIGFSSQPMLIIESQTEEILVKTQSIYISNDISLFSKQSVIGNKEDRIDKLKLVGNFSLLNTYQYIPEDFHLMHSNNEKATTIFNKLCELFSIGFLFDITNIENDIIKYNINGYKSIFGEFEFKIHLPNDVEEYFKIYNWCFNEGNFNDKIGLARNIISLHLAEKNNVILNGTPYQSLLSSYKIYEKQNIKQYIEIRNKISEQLLSFNERANKIVETFASGFQKSALALISFYISAIAIKLLGKGEFLNLFTLDATILAVSFITCSFIYFFFSSWEVKVQRNRFIDSYQNMKSRYLDLLDNNDINRILNNDKDYNADLKFINDKKRNYTIIWVSFLGILLVTTIILFVIYNLNQILETPIGIYLVKN